MSVINFSKTNNTAVVSPTAGKFKLFFDLDGLPKYKDSNGDVHLFGNGNASTEAVSVLVQDYSALELTIGQKQKDYNEKMLELVLSLIPHPTYLRPYITLSSLPVVFGEIGSSISVNLLSVWNQRDGGGILNMGVKKNGTVVSSTLSFAESLVLSATTVSYVSFVDFATGAVKNNSAGIPDPVGRILADTVESNTQSVFGIYPVFYGAFDVLPVPASVNMSLLTKAVIQSSSTVEVNMGATDKYLLIAIPTASTAKTKWFVNELNQGSIGGVTNLFGDTVSVNKSSPSAFWSNIPYTFYISNYKTTVNLIQLRNT